MLVKLQRPPNWLLTGIVLKLWLAWITCADWDGDKRLER